MKGCELYGRYVFLDASKNSRLEEKKRRSADGRRDGKTGREASQENGLDHHPRLAGD
jgi:hypothetical protein